MELRQQDFVQQIGRTLYRAILPASLRTRLGNNTLVQSLRATIHENGESLPYILLQEKHIANLKVVLNRNALLSSLPKGAISAEIGVNRGDFSQRILSYAQPKQLHLIDMWDSERYHAGLMTHVQSRFQPQIADGDIQIHRGHSLEILRTFPDHYFDWVYLDTDHSYTTTAQELILCSRKVKQGGIIAGHDYVTGDWKMRLRYGVVEAVNEFCVKNDWEMIFVTHETHRHCSFAIRQIAG